MEQATHPQSFQTERSPGLPQVQFDFAESDLNWHVLLTRPRVDASNIEEIQNWVTEQLKLQHRWLVLDLKGTRFMGLPAIQFLEKLSLTLQNAGGALAFVAMPDKTRRIFEIYGSLSSIYLVEKLENLKAVQAQLMNPFFRLKNF